MRSKYDGGGGGGGGSGGGAGSSGGSAGGGGGVSGGGPVRTLDLLISRLYAEGELAMVTLRLFDSLLALNCEDVMIELCFRHMVGPAAPPPPPLGPDSVWLVGAARYFSTVKAPVLVGSGGGGGDSGMAGLHSTGPSTAASSSFHAGPHTHTGATSGGGGGGGAPTDDGDAFDAYVHEATEAISGETLNVHRC